MTDPRNRRRAARAIALRAEDARQMMIRRALLAVSGGLIAALGCAAIALKGAGIAF
ncbi:hypothetical protein [Ancylobacter mangrovi]|uniref:Uncharacterized protein n=1 Tax=Ancylobacter mangrovi TaxID=2972472 RepID=A0A9X2PE25_9HYPH|nr:hypothetical protein [Ancylobacter mangrovi]MCS0496976.1 hypothetical protein [Ancylobacter mangrovi]MCS0503536.1 hypothetical protein [Ancylobacter mangrovi]